MVRDRDLSHIHAKALKENFALASVLGVVMTNIQTNQIAQQWVKFAISVDVRTTLKMFVVESHILEEDPNRMDESKLMSLNNKAPL